MKQVNITVLPGDGIGPEVTAQATAVLKAACEKSNIGLNLTTRPIGGSAYDTHKTPLPAETVEGCLTSDAVLLGAVGGPQWEGLPYNLRPEAGLLGIRSKLGLYANLRPAKIFAPLKGASPLKEAIIGQGVDIMVVRELTGGIYFGEKGLIVRDGEESAFDTEAYSVSEIERIAVTAFETAMKRNKKITSVDKANVLESSRLWRKTVIRVAQQYPEVALDHLYVDNASMQLVKAPYQFDVLLTSNMFGDILSDEASMLTGSIGMLPSASLAKGTFGLYEPIHGSAPDIAGKGLANPAAAILSVAMMFKYSLGEPALAGAVEQAVEKALLCARTADIADPSLPVVSTSEMGQIMINQLNEILK